MSSTGAGYDLAANIYSPDGRVFQIEYAGKAVEASGYVHLLLFIHNAYLCFVYFSFYHDHDNNSK